MERAPAGTFVLRGADLSGAATLKNLHAVHTAYGVWGVCVAAEPGLSVAEIAAYKKFGSRTMMVGVSDEIEAVGCAVVKEPGREWPSALIVFPSEPDWSMWQDLREVMGRRPIQDNPGYRGKH